MSNIKAEKHVFYSILFRPIFIINILLLYFLLLLYYLLFRFVVNMQYFRNITSPDSYFFFEVNNQFFIEINVSMKSLKSGLSCERIIFVVFFYQKYIFCFQFFGSTLEKK